MTRDQLSQLLLANISMATDILDLIDVLSFVRIGNDLTFVYATLTLYSIAHIQFTLNITATAPRPVIFVFILIKFYFKLKKKIAA